MLGQGWLQGLFCEKGRGTEGAPQAAKSNCFSAKMANGSSVNRRGASWSYFPRLLALSHHPLSSLVNRERERQREREKRYRQTQTNCCQDSSVLCCSILVRCSLDLFDLFRRSATQPRSPSPHRYKSRLSSNSTTRPGKPRKDGLELSARASTRQSLCCVAASHRLQRSHWCAPAPF